MISKSSLKELFLFLLSFFLLLSFFIELRFFSIAFSIISISLMIISSQEIIIKDLLMLILISLLLIFSFLVNGSNFIFINVFIINVFIFIALKNHKTNFKIWLIFFLITSMYLLYKTLTVYDINNDIFVGTSRNQISIILLYLLFFIFLSRPNLYILYFCAFLALVVCYYSGSRSGFLSLAILNGLLFFHKKIKNSFKLLIFLSLTFFIMIYGLNSDFSFSEGTAISNISALDATKDPRFDVLNCYLSNIIPERFIFGLSYDNGNFCSKAIGSEYSNVNFYNHHNSFLSLLSYSTLAGVLIIILSITKLIYLIKRNYILFCFFASFIVRVFFDNVIFFGYIDFIFLYFLFYNDSRKDSADI